MTVPHDNPDNPTPDISATADDADRIGQSPEAKRPDEEPTGSQRGSVNIEQHS